MLLEREREVAELGDLVEAVRDGRGATVLLEAPAGLGKSTLLARAAELAGERGVRALHARALELERETAWGVARSLLGDDAVPEATPGRDASFAILHGLYWAAMRLAEDRPLLLVVDDAQWADEPSLRFLLYLLGRTETAPLGVLAAARPSDRPLLQQLAGDPAVRVREPAPLGPVAVEALVRGRVERADDELTRRCLELTGGNPLRLRELLAALEHEGELEASLATAVQRRLANLPPAARALAQAVAVLEDDAPPEIAWELARGDQVAAGDDAVRSGGETAPVGAGGEPARAGGETARVAADALRRADILRAGEPLGFTHPLVRAAVYAAVEDRAAAHARAAAVLARGGAAPERVSAHLLEAAPAGDPHVAATLELAASRAMDRGAPASAHRYLERALREPPERPKRVLAALGRAAAMLGRTDAADHMEAAIALMDDPRERAELLCELGHALHHRGSLAAAADAFTRGRAELDERDDLALQLEAGYLTTALLFPERAAEAHERLGELMTGAGTPAERALASKVMMGRMVAGEPRELLVATALEVWGGGRLLDEGGAESQALAHVAGGLGIADEFALADEVIRVSMTELDKRGWIEWSNALRSQRARHRAWTGPIAGAIEDARAALEVFRGTDVLYVPAASAPLVRALLDDDRPDEAEAAVRLMDAHIVAPGFFAAWRHDAVARLHAYRGEYAQARDAFLASGENAEKILAKNPALWPWRSGAGAAMARLGDGGAVALIEEELALAKRFGAPRAIGIAQRELGIATGDPKLLQAAAKTLETSGARVEYAEALLALGDLPHAIAVAEAAGSRRIARLARERLAATRGDDRLTPAERRVAGLAASGRTNREIAAELALSAKSVEWHLGNVYRKLGVSGRRGLRQP